MVNKLLQAITVQLHSAFGDEYKYYFENVKQNLTKPCFTVDLIESTIRSRNRLQYNRAIPVVVHYFSDKKSTVKEDSYDIGELIHETLEYVPFENAILRGDDISWDIIDEDVLQLFVTYRFKTEKTSSNEDPMGELVENRVTHT